MTTTNRWNYLSVVVILFLALALFCTWQAHHTTDYTAGKLTNYNNYIIFRQSYYHLMEGKDLCAPYPNEYWDLYKYSPTFALLMAPLALLPTLVGLAGWNLLNVVFVLIGINMMRGFDARAKTLLLLFATIEMVTSLQNEQSNGLLAGLIILGFALAERRKLFLATLCIVLSCYIKILGLAAFAIFLLYPDKWKAALYTVFWTAFLFVLPLCVVSWQGLMNQYAGWGNMLSHDHTTDGLSVMKLMQSWIGWEGNKLWIQLLGIVLFCIPLLRWQYYKIERYRLLLLSSVLIWIVIFNHKAESPTFIIAVLGVSIWFFSGKRSVLDISLLVLCLLFTQLSATDIFPREWRNGFFLSHAIKAIPCVLIWIRIVAEMLLMKPSEKVISVQ